MNIQHEIVEAVCWGHQLWPPGYLCQSYTYDQLGTSALQWWGGMEQRKWFS